MGQLTINIPDDRMQDVVDVLSAHFGYKDDSGMTKAQFVKSKTIEWFKSLYVSAKAQALQRQQMIQLREAQQTDFNNLTLS